jgi:hypothetical protein
MSDGRPLRASHRANSSFPMVLPPAQAPRGSPGSEPLCSRGTPERAGLYTIMLQIPAKTRIAAHDHQDDRWSGDRCVSDVVHRLWRLVQPG